MTPPSVHTHSPPGEKFWLRGLEGSPFCHPVFLSCILTEYTQGPEHLISYSKTKDGRYSLGKSCWTDLDDHNPTVLSPRKGEIRLQKSESDSIKCKCMAFSLKTELKQPNCAVQVWSKTSNDTIKVETEKVTIVCTRYDFNAFLKGCAFMEQKLSVPFKAFIRQMSVPLLH